MVLSSWVDLDKRGFRSVSGGARKIGLCVVLLRRQGLVVVSSVRPRSLLFFRVLRFAPMTRVLLEEEHALAPWLPITSAVLVPGLSANVVSPVMADDEDAPADDEDGFGDDDEFEDDDE